MPRIFMTGKQRALLAQCWYGQSDPLYAVVSRCVADAGCEFATGSTAATEDELSAILNCADQTWDDGSERELTPIFVSVDTYLFGLANPDAKYVEPPLGLVDDDAGWVEFGGVEGVRCET